jgi:hypothetical protein
MKYWRNKTSYSTNKTYYSREELTKKSIYGILKRKRRTYYSVIVEYNDVCKAVHKFLDVKIVG